MSPSGEGSSSGGNPEYRSILSRENPDIIDAWNGRSYANTTSGKDAFDRVVFNGEANCTIQEWTDFTYEAINLAYGDLLDHVPTNERRAHTPTPSQTMIEDEVGIDDLSKASQQKKKSDIRTRKNGWYTGTYSIVRAPLKYAGAVLRRRPTVCPQRAGLETDPALLGLRLKWNHPQMESTVFKPDWAVFDRKVEKLYYSTAGKDPKKALAYAIGDSKMCQKWKSAWIHRSLADGYIDRNPAPTTSGKPLQKTHDVEVQRLRPLEQLATYCRFGETRYGFIITQEEVVAFRIRRLDPLLIASVVAFDKPCAGIEYKSIPWHASGSGQLTANLAIWALGCMGMNDHHRIMETSDREPLASMVRLTKWTHDEKNKLYRNDISGREISEEDWEKLGDEIAFVKLDKQGGASYTSTFTTGGGVTSITQGVQAINLNTTTSSTRSRKPAQGAAQQPKSAGQGSASTSKPKPVGQVAAPSIKLEPSAQSAASSSQAQPAGQAAASPSKPTPGTTSPPKKYTIAGKKAAPA